MADALIPTPKNFNVDSVLLHACAFNALTLAQIELSSSETCYVRAEGRIRKALEAVMILGGLSVQQLNGGAA